MNTTVTQYKYLRQYIRDRSIRNAVGIPIVNNYHVESIDGFIRVNNGNRFLAAIKLIHDIGGELLTLHSRSVTHGRLTKESIRWENPPTGNFRLTSFEDGDWFWEDGLSSQTPEQDVTSFMHIVFVDVLQIATNAEIIQKMNGNDEYTGIRIDGRESLTIRALRRTEGVDNTSKLTKRMMQRWNQNGYPNGNLFVYIVEGCFNHDSDLNLSMRDIISSAFIANQTYDNIITTQNTDYIDDDNVNLFVDMGYETIGDCITIGRIDRIVDKAFKDDPVCDRIAHLATAISVKYSELVGDDDTTEEEYLGAVALSYYINQHSTVKEPAGILSNLDNMVLKMYDVMDGDCLVPNPYPTLYKAKMSGNISLSQTESQLSIITNSICSLLKGNLHEELEDGTTDEESSDYYGTTTESSDESSEE